MAQTAYRTSFSVIFGRSKSTMAGTRREVSPTNSNFGVLEAPGVPSGGERGVLTWKGKFFVKYFLIELIRNHQVRKFLIKGDTKESIMISSVSEITTPTRRRQSRFPKTFIFVELTWKLRNNVFPWVIDVKESKFVGTVVA